MASPPVIALSSVMLRAVWLMVSAIARLHTLVLYVKLALLVSRVTLNVIHALTATAVLAVLQSAMATAPSTALVLVIVR